LRYGHILQAVYETPWAIMPDRLQTILAILHERASGYVPSAAEIRERLQVRHSDAEHPEPDAAASAPQSRAPGAVAVIPVVGIITQRGGVDMETSEPLFSAAKLAAQVQMLVADENVSAIVLDVDSPGGSVFGVQEAADAIFKARGSKPIVAVANSLAASAAYWLASAADELVVTPSGLVGSVGVIAAHEDLSARLEMLGVKVTLITAGKYKAEGHPAMPLDDEAKDEMQRRVDKYYGAFVSGVARNRGTGVDDVRDNYGGGRVFDPKEAVAIGMADRVGTLAETIDGLARRRQSGPRSSAPSVVPLATARQRLDLHRAE
jgi:signal peptide peptidase SppA